MLTSVFLPIIYKRGTPGAPRRMDDEIRCQKNGLESEVEFYVEQVVAAIVG